MIRGITFNIIEAEDHTLNGLLQSIDIEKYIWYNIESQGEVWETFDGGELFKNSYYLGEDFVQLIKRWHYIIFLKLQAYFQNDNFNDICSYEDFMKSSCQILVLINDCVFVEIYAKDIRILEKIYEDAVTNKYTCIKYITDDNDPRKIMNVL